MWGSRGWSTRRARSWSGFRELLFGVGLAARAEQLELGLERLAGGGDGGVDGLGLAQVDHRTSPRPAAGITQAA